MLLRACGLLLLLGCSSPPPPPTVQASTRQAATLTKAIQHVQAHAPLSHFHSSRISPLLAHAAVIRRS